MYCVLICALNISLLTAAVHGVQGWPLTGGVPGKKPQVSCSDVVLLGYVESMRSRRRMAGCEVLSEWLRMSSLSLALLWGTIVG